MIEQIKTEITDEDWAVSNKLVSKLRRDLPEEWFINVTIHPFCDTTLIFGIKER